LAYNATRAGQLVSRYGPVIGLAWIGFDKYMLIDHSPLMSWVYHIFSVNAVRRGLGQ
jgi:hypothetical protein